uniref:Uncharacterized protein n=3 Tax=Rhizophagus irregularis TaxID=588596 RepID=U9U925_RHIID
MNAQNSNDARKTGYGESRSAIKRRKSFPLYHLVFRATHATTVILTLRLKVRRRFDVSNIPRYNYGYTRALNNRKHYLQNCSIMIVEDVSLKANAQNKYYVSKQDQDISTIRTIPFILWTSIRMIILYLTKPLHEPWTSIYEQKTNIPERESSRLGLKVQGSSTGEIILSIQTIIEHQKSHKQPLYILLQDLSKAYDRVDIPLLKHSLSEPSLRYGNRNHTISPLLWVIYYDPMFEGINNTNYGGYTMTATMPKNIYDPLDSHTLTVNTKLLGYLDDTTWFSNSLDNLTAHLEIADDFYNLANTKLLTNDKQLLTHTTHPFVSDKI